jgi:hypothetical protein
MKVGNFAARLTNGTQAVTGVGFQPAALLFFTSGETADGTSTEAFFTCGFGLSSTVRAAIGTTSNDGSQASGRYHTNAHAIVLTTTAGAVGFAADLDSMDADGFTLDVTASGSAHVITYVALDSTEVTDASMVAFTSKTSTGTQGYTGAGFQPDFVFIITAALNTAAPSGSTQGTYSYGFGTDATDQGVVGGIATASGGTANQTSLKTDKIISVPTVSAGNLLIEAELDSLDADGFTLNWTTANATGRLCWALCLEGPAFNVGNFTQPTSTGNAGVTGVGFIPGGVFLAASDRTAAGTAEPMVLALGAASGATARGTHAMAKTTGAGGNLADSATEQDKALTIYTAGTPTLEAEADLVSFDADGFTLNWTTADATARLILYWATEAGVSAAITGTVGDGATEAEIVAGSGTVIITLTGDTWVAAGATFDAIRQDIIDGIDSAQAEGTGWDAVVKAGLAVTDVVRTSATVVTVTLPAFGSYNITANETITVTVPSTAVVGGVATIATPTFAVTAVITPAMPPFPNRVLRVWPARR